MKYLRNDSKAPHITFLIVFDTLIIHSTESTNNFRCHELGRSYRWAHTIKIILIYAKSVTLLLRNRYGTYCMSPRTSIEVFALDAKSKSHNLAPSSWKSSYYVFIVHESCNMTYLDGVTMTSFTETYRVWIRQENISWFYISMSDSFWMKKFKSKGNRVNKRFDFTLRNYFRFSSFDAALQWS